MLSLVLGIGSQLITFLLGWSQSALPDKSAPSKKGLPFFLGALFISSFPLEFLGLGKWGDGIRAFVTTVVAITYWNIHKRPPKRGSLSLGIRLSALCLIAGLWIYTLSSMLELSGLHLAFIGGFSLLTLMIATQVTLSHGGYALAQSGKAIGWAVFFLLLSALVRFTAAWTTTSFAHHLAYASILWILAMAIWASHFIPKMIRRAP